MVAQAQECIFKGLLLLASDTPDSCPAQLQLAQEAAQVRPRSPARGTSKRWPSCGHSESRAQQDLSSIGLDPSQAGMGTASNALCHSLMPVAAPVRVVLRTGTEALDVPVWLG